MLVHSFSQLPFGFTHILGLTFEARDQVYHVGGEAGSAAFGDSFVVLILEGRLDFLILPNDSAIFASKIRARGVPEYKCFG